MPQLQVEDDYIMLQYLMDSYKLQDIRHDLKDLVNVLTASASSRR
jgi:hypothetical protein